MKVRWREHEAVLISMIAAFFIAGYIAQIVQQPAQQIALAHAIPSSVKAGIHLNYYSRVLLPQIGSVLVLLLAYGFINRAVVPALLKPGGLWVGKILLAVFQLLVVAYIIGPGINFLSFYSNPYYIGSTYIPFTFGAHPQPFQNTLGGMGESIFVLLIYTAYLLVRERVIAYYTKRAEKAAYGIMIINKISAFLVLLFASPIFLSVFNLVHDSSFYHYYFFLTLPAFAVFTTNVYWLFPLKGEDTFLSWKFMGPLLFTSFVYSLCFSIFLKDDWSLLTVLTNWAALILMITPISWLDYQQRKDRLLQLRGAEKALVKSTADLQSLRAQINPHFLFNALNTLYGTALIEGSKNTADGIQKLGDMMRFMLHDNTLDYISMDKEIEYLKNYISLQKLRNQLSPAIIIEDDISDKHSNHQIAPMLFIPFIENAFKHGISLSEKSWIKIKLDFDDEQISFEVHNSIHPLAGNDPERENPGIGLKNVQDRLQIMYKNHYHFIHGIEGNEFVVRLKIKPVTGKIMKKATKLNWLPNA